MGDHCDRNNKSGKRRKRESRSVMNASQLDRDRDVGRPVPSPRLRGRDGAKVETKTGELVAHRLGRREERKQGLHLV